jgi:hypothetical protein
MNASFEDVSWWETIGICLVLILGFCAFGCEPGRSDYGGERAPVPGVESAEYPLIVYHDDSRGVTCWRAKFADGIACLPDRELVDAGR